MRILLVATVGIALVTASPVSVSGGQVLARVSEMARQGGRPLGPEIAMNTADSDPIDTHQAEQRAKLQNDDRQKQLAADTEKLLALATELKQQVDKSNKNTLSVGVIKKADEIEKLAHSLKERMK